MDTLTAKTAKEVTMKTLDEVLSAVGVIAAVLFVMWAVPTTLKKIDELAAQDRADREHRPAVHRVR